MTPPSPQPSTPKDALRQQMLAKRNAISSADRLEAAQSVALHYADHPYLAPAKTFAGYYPFRNELDVLPIFNRMSQYGRTMALPAVTGDMLVFKHWAPSTPLTTDRYGVKTPEVTSEEMVPELVLVPLLAFDAQGYRLGYGGGFYDRVMQKYRDNGQDTLFFGVAYTQQEVDTVYAEPHDQPLDGILTDLGVSMFPRHTPPSSL